MKVLGKAYAKIPHLPGSQIDATDHACAPWQSAICTAGLRDERDAIIVTEKLDGSCVAILRQNGILQPVLRSGALAASSRFEQHHLFHQWVLFHQERFLGLLRDGERVCGEWLAQAHGTRYQLPHEPFVIFDLFDAQDRHVSHADLRAAVDKQHLVTPRIISVGPAISVEAVRKLLEPSGHGALDPVEGAVWRVERDGQFDFLAKWVRPDKVNGLYLGQQVWNWRPEW